MKKKIYVLSTILLSAVALSLSSCLKDSRFVDLSKVGTIVEFPNGGQVNFGPDAQTSSADTITAKYAVNIASPNAPSTATTVVLSVNDPAIVSAYNAAHTAVTYLPMPQGSYVVTPTTLTIPAGQRTATFTVTFYKNQLDPSKSYMLPVAIKSAGSYNISGNMGTHYFHFIGNDFAGTYEHFYTRWNVPDTTGAPSTPRTDEGTDTFLPVNPTSFSVVSDYYYQPAYLVSFTKTGTGASATYSNWTVTFPPDQIASGLTTPSGGAVTLATGPLFAPNKIAFGGSTQYSYADALKLFRFYFTTNARGIIDEFVKP